MLFGTRETGISPEFARVLRSQILGKDRRWLVLVTPTSESADGDATDKTPVLRVRTGLAMRDNPFVAATISNRRLPTGKRGASAP